MQLRSLSSPLATVLLGGFLAASGAIAAQSLPAVSLPAPRVIGDWRASAGVTVAHSKPSLIAAAVDLGAAPGNQTLGRMILLLAPSSAQRQALAAELADLQNPSSPNYHHWLTPQTFAQNYANNPSDVGAVAAWLESEGFTVASLPTGLGWIEFSGTVAQVEQAFGAQVHLVSISGDTGSGNTGSGSTRAVLASGITVPGALSPVVAGLVSLDGVRSAPALTTPQSLTVSAADLASLTSPAGAAALTPRLVVQLLDVIPLASEGVNGAGQTVAIVSRSNVNRADVAAFRSVFGLPASSLEVSVNGPDPGLNLDPAPNDDQAEATLAASWAGAAAPGAQILLVPAASTSATDGVDLSLAAVIDRKLANVIAVGYSACEAALSPARQAFYSALYQQAAAEGITIIGAAGDGGAAACTPAGSTTPIDTGLAVNGLASTPWNTVVGVAGYGAGGAAAGTSALTAWSPADPANSAYAPADPAYASGGGSSKIYARQPWQPVPAGLAASSTATSSRFLPDLALPTALDSSTNPGLAFCLSSSGTSSGCTLMRSGGSGVATAFFAGVAALINQKNGVQGSLAPSLYAASRAFNDVAQGTAKLPCVLNSTGCDASGLIGFAAGSGYDLATGFGVPDVHKLVTTLATPAVATTPTITLSISPAQTSNTYNPTAIVNITVKVVDSTGAGIPTGTVTLYNSTNSGQLTSSESLSSSGSTTNGSTYTFTLEPSSFTNYPAGSAEVAYNLGVSYNDPSGAYATSNPGNLLTLTSEQSPTALTITPATTSPALGSSTTVTITTDVAASGPPAGSLLPTGSVTLTDNGTTVGAAALSTANGATTAVFTVPITTAANSLIASYAGDNNYSADTTTPYTLTATKSATSVVLTSNHTTAQPGESVIFTATVTPLATPASSVEQNPSGTVLFLSGTTLLGSATLIPVAGTNSSTATWIAQTLPGGQDSLSASYLGDSIYNPGTSNVLSILEQGFTFAASPTNPPTNLNITQGGTGSVSFVITNVGSYAGLVQVICTVPAQDDMTCGPTPQQITPTSTVTFTIQSYVTGGPAYAALGKPRLPRSLWPRAAGGALLAGLVFFLLPRGRRARGLLLARRFVVLLVLLAGLAATGIGCSTSTTVSNSGTPLGVATLQVTATADVDNAVAAQSLNFTVNVQPQ